MGSHYPVGDIRRIGNSFSMEDMMTAARGNLAEIRAVTENYTFIAKRPENGWGTIEEIKSKYRDIENEVSALHKEMKEKGIWTETQSDATYYHAIMKKLAEQMGIGYEKKCNIIRGRK